MDSSKLQSLDPVELQREKPWRSHRGSTDPDPVAGDHVAHGVLQEGLWRGMAGVMFGHVRTQKMWSDWKLGENWRQKLITSYHNFMRNSEKPTRRDIFRPPRPPPTMHFSEPPRVGAVLHPLWVVHLVLIERVENWRLPIDTMLFCLGYTRIMYFYTLDTR